MHEAENLRGRLIIEVVPRLHQVAVRHLHLQTELKVAPLLRHEPRSPSQPTHHVAHSGLLVIDRKERVPCGARQLAVGLLVLSKQAAKGLASESGISALLVREECDYRFIAEHLPSSIHGAPNGASRPVLPGSMPPIFDSKPFNALLGHLASGSYGCGFGPDAIATLALDQHRNGQGAEAAIAFKGLQLVELKLNRSRQRVTEIQVESTQMAGNLPQLQLRAPQSQAEPSRAHANANAHADELQEAGVQVRTVISIVHPESLPREGAAAGKAEETRDWVRATKWVVMTVAPVETGVRMKVLGTAAVRAEGGLEHGRFSSPGRKQALGTEVD